MSLLAFATLLGTVLPLAIAVVQQEKWSNRLRSAVAFLLCVFAAAATTYAKGYWHGLHWVSVDAFLTALAGMVVGTWGSYKRLWAEFGITQWIEQATSFVSVHKDLVAEVLAQASPLDKTRLAAELAKELGSVVVADPSPPPA